MHLTDQAQFKTQQCALGIVLLPSLPPWSGRAAHSRRCSRTPPIPASSPPCCRVDRLTEQAQFKDQKTFPGQRPAVTSPCRLDAPHPHPAPRPVDDDGASPLCHAACSRRCRQTLPLPSLPLHITHVAAADATVRAARLFSDGTGLTHLQLNSNSGATVSMRAFSCSQLP